MWMGSEEAGSLGCLEVEGQPQSRWSSRVVPRWGAGRRPEKQVRTELHNVLNNEEEWLLV